MSENIVVIMVSAPSDEVARSLARRLIEEKLAGCVNLIPRIVSVYLWEGVLREEQEVIMMIKTQRARLKQVEAWMVANHPYTVPEIVALKVEQVNSAYADWVIESSSE